MNRAFLIIGIPAFVTSFCWLAFGWGWRVAAIVTGIELAAAVAGVIYLARRQQSRARSPEASR
jgi:membrane protein implicated in regulation of membrane protease activity